MKAFKKHIFLFILILIGTYFYGIKGVEANIDWKGVTIECIYSDGGLYEYSYNKYTGDYVVNRFTYNLKGVDNSRNQTTSSVIYSDRNEYSDPISEDENGVPHCLDTVRTSIVSGGGEDEESSSTVTYIKFYDEDDTASEDEEFNDDDFGESWYDHFWWWQDSSASLAEENAEEYDLVSENYVITEDAGEPVDVYSYKRENKKEEGEVSQAVSSPKYLTILDYENAILIQSKEKTNYLGATFSKPSEYYFTDADPKSYTGNNSTSTYYFESSMIKGKSSEATGYYRYVYAGIIDDDGDAESGALCDKIMPQTSKDLATIIRWAQLLVPVLLIILTALDIGKIVMSGNIEEELPKQKNKIVVRFIVAIVFFFLPLILKILLDSVQIDSGTTEEEISAIESIKCIIDMV